MVELSPAERARLTRRTLIDIALRRQRPGTGSRLSRLEYALNEWPDLTALLNGIPWAVIGGVATRNYMPERSTQDLAIAILPRDASVVAERLRSAGFEYVGPLRIGGDAWKAPGGTPIDVIEGAEPRWATALAAAKTNFDQQGLPVVPLNYLVLIKLVSARLVDSGDIGRMLGSVSEEVLAEVRATIASHAPELEADLESLIVVGQLEAQGLP